MAGRLAESGHAPLARFVANIIVTGVEDGIVTVLSRGLMIHADGTVGAVTHDDVLRRHDGAWRISRRAITPMRAGSSAQRL